MKNKPHVVLTDPFIEEIMNSDLKPHAFVTIAQDNITLQKALPFADAIITKFSDKIDARLLKRAPNLRVVGNFAVGTNNIDFNACKDFGVRVVHTPDVVTRSTAELVLALLLAAARRIPEGDVFCRRGLFKKWNSTLLLGMELQGRNAVLVGAGRIGNETEKLFRGFGLKTSFITRADSNSSILKKLKSAQILSLHFPLTGDTHHWLNSERIAQLPADAIVINTTRGAAIDEKALILALRKRRIFSAGLDVYENEPSIPASLKRLPNCVLMPHIGTSTVESRAAMSRLVISGVLGVLAGKRPRNEVVF